MISTGLLLRILRHRATWGVGIALGVLLAVWANGALKYRQGYRNGFVARAVDARRDADQAKAAADSAWRVMYVRYMAEAEAVKQQERAAARARARTVAAETRLAAALAAVHADSEPPSPACGELATACANAQAAWSAERDTMGSLIAVQDTTIMTLRTVVAQVPARIQAEVGAALVKQRAQFKAPSRSKWAAIGAALGAAVAWVAR